jgi:hypothetical protein
MARATLLNSTSLGPSRLIDISLGSSIAPRGNDLLQISFPHPWGTQQGPVFHWHHSQPVTRFASIQYRKDREEPFCHEFLVLKLTDGSVCRLERRCDPETPTAALAPHGTTAQDFAQVWPNDYLNELDNLSDVVAEIEYPQEFDILDVLSICYAIQQDPEAKQYSLRRYNCYFFCWSIMAFLARRTARWEQLLTKAAWQDVMHTASQKLASLSSHHDPKLYPDELAFRVTRLLSRGQSLPSQFLLNALESELAKEDTRNHVCSGLTGLLWNRNASTVIEERLGTAIKEAARTTARHPTVGGSILEDACSEETLKTTREIMDMQELRLVPEQWNSRPLRAWREQAQIKLEECQAEHPVGMIDDLTRGIKMMTCSVTGALDGAKKSFQACISEGPDVCKRIRNDWLRRQALKAESRFRRIKEPLHMAWSISKFVTRVVSLYARTGAMGARVNFMNSSTGNEFPPPPDWIDMTDASISGALDVAGKAGIDDPELVRACVLRNLDGSTDFTVQRSMAEEGTANMCRRWDKTWQSWVVNSVATPLANLISERMCEIEKKSIKIILPVRLYFGRTFLVIGYLNFPTG